MPIRVQNDLPVKEILEQENIFVMDEYRAAHQDIRPLSVQHADSGRCDFCAYDKPCVEEYVYKPYL